MSTAPVQTVSGRYIDVLAPWAGDIQLGDIAHHLANLCRFSGAVREFYSVAQHSVMVASILPPALRLAGLLHDASEAYLGDVISPIKRHIPSYQYMEELVMAAVEQRFTLDLTTQDRAVIKRADLVLLATERRDLMPADKTEWPILAGVAPLQERIRPLPPAEAVAAFMAAYEQYSQLDLLGA